MIICLFIFLIFITLHGTWHLVGVQEIPSHPHFLPLPLQALPFFLLECRWSSSAPCGRAASPAPSDLSHFAQRCRTALITDRRLLGRKREREKSGNLSSLDMTLTNKTSGSQPLLQSAVRCLGQMRRLGAAAKLGLEEGELGRSRCLQILNT